MGADQQVTLQIDPAPWSQAMADLLAPCVTNAAALVAIGRQVVNGVATGFLVSAGGRHVAAFVLRVDGDEGVIVAGAGRMNGVKLLQTLMPSIEARFSGCRSIRFHTARPGMTRVMARLGYRGAEVVMQKDLNHAG